MCQDRIRETFWLSVFRAVKPELCGSCWLRGWWIGSVILTDENLET